MYPKKQPKSDRERFLAAFQKRVGASPEQYLRRKLASGVDERELHRLYDMLAVEIAMKARCTALKYDDLQTQLRPAAERHRERAASASVPVCKCCAHKGQKFWGCSNYPVCRFTIRIEDGGE